MFTLATCCLTMSLDLTFPASYAILFFTASDFTFSMRHIHNGASFPLWRSCFILYGPVHHQLPEFTQTQVHRVGDAIQPSHPLSSPFPPVPNPLDGQIFLMCNFKSDVQRRKYLPYSLINFQCNIIFS